MIKHIVFLKVKDGNNEIITSLIDQLNRLPSLIKEIKFYEVGKNISKSQNAYDVSLISLFETINDLEIYRSHEQHQKVLSYIKENQIETRVVDYMI